MKNELSLPRILGITLAREGSKGIPRKNLINVGGKPLIAYTIREALRSKHLSRYVVSTDGLETQALALSLGAESPFLMPSKFSEDTSTSVEALQHAVNFLELQEEKRYDIIVEIMATNPLKIAEDIDGCIEKLIATNADTVIAVHRLIDQHPARVKKIVDDKIMDFCVPETLESRRQDLAPEAYIRSGSVYVMTRSELMEEGRRYGSHNSRPYILPPERSVNIDSNTDLLIAELMIVNAQDKKGPRI